MTGGGNPARNPLSLDGRGLGKGEPPLVLSLSKDGRRWFNRLTMSGGG